MENILQALRLYLRRRGNSQAMAKVNIELTTKLCVGFVSE